MHAGARDTVAVASNSICIHEVSYIIGKFSLFSYFRFFSFLLIFFWLRSCILIWWFCMFSDIVMDGDSDNNNVNDSGSDILLCYGDSDSVVVLW